MIIVALVPAHNEQASITLTVAALRAQTVPPDRILVVADNCTDDTVEMAQLAGAEVMETVGNVSKKAGALNQALDWISPSLRGDDLILIQDADSILAPDFIERAIANLDADPKLGAVGGVFRGGPGGGFVGHLQRNEYARYARDVARLGGKCLVVTGTAAVFKAKTLREVSQARKDGRLPWGVAEGEELTKMRGLTEEERMVYFWSKFRRSEAGCLEWGGRTNGDGYGGFDMPLRRGRNRSVLTHRQAWEYTYGPVPDGMHVLHTCDNPSCGEPEHLFLGTHADNMADMVRKGRKPSRRGEKNGRAVLSEEDVLAIREGFTGRHGEKAALARKYGVTPTTIHNILTGKLWPKTTPEGSRPGEPGVYDTTVLTED